MKSYFFSLLASVLFFTSNLHADVAQEEHPVVILGGGIGALTSATYLARAGIVPVVITGPFIGGTITQSHNVQNWPGEMSISGLELSDKVKQQAEANGALLKSEIVVSVDFSKRPYTVTTKQMIGSNEHLKQYKTDAVIIALGANSNFLNVPGEVEHFSKGVYTCAVCDGAFYKDKIVTVVGGGDSALLEAEYLSNIASKVHLLVRKDHFRTVDQQRLKEVLANPNIEVHYKTIVKEIKGDDEKLTHLLLQDATKQNSWELATDALFLAIGSRPNTDLFSNFLQLDPSGYIVLKNHQETSLDGIYAIGDVADPEFKQAISAAGDAAKAAIQAQKFLASHTAPSPKKQPIAKVDIKPEFKKVIEIHSKEQFDKEVREAKSPIFIDFYATYCAPCRTFGPLYDNWAKEYGGKIKFLKINADHAPEIFRHYQIRAVPTLIILDEKGAILRRTSGLNEFSDIEKKLEKIKNSTIVTSQDF